ncbi:hypothetical protein [Ruegeria arenilitoris]|uniref:hypothetical protein n=1 Tax=Ruegeria arenilitoris TaxID=1173585 RepID=UPI00147A07B0|nr:hypothetical protein [Ruegeria arenilitoris]
MKSTRQTASFRLGDFDTFFWWAEHSRSDHTGYYHSKDGLTLKTLRSNFRFRHVPISLNFLGFGVYLLELSQRFGGALLKIVATCGQGIELGTDLH